MKVFKVTTSWTGFSEITVEAETQEEAKVLVEKVEYDTDKEVLTGYGLDYGYENEEIIEVKEIQEVEDESWMSKMQKRNFRFYGRF